MAYSKEVIKEKLFTEVNWLYRGILAIYNKQTTEEQSAEATLKHNKVGFNSCDAYILSSFARQILQKGRLSARQIDVARKKMPKYAGQLIKIAKEKEHGMP